MIHTGTGFVQKLAFLPSIDTSWSLGGLLSESFFDGAIELYLIFSFAWLAQQLIGLLYYSVKTIRRTCRVLARAAYWMITFMC